MRNGVGRRRCFWMRRATSAIGYLTLQERGLKGPPRGLKLGPALAMAAMVAQRWPWLSLVFFCLGASSSSVLIDIHRISSIDVCQLIR